jgi:hypothetical protein
MRAKLSYANVAATLALVIAIASGGGAAIAEPIASTAASTAQSVKKALKLGKQSSKSSKQALKTAKSARTTANQALTASANSYSKAVSDGRYALRAGIPVRALSADEAQDSEKLDGLDSTAFARAGKTTNVGGDQLGTGTYDCFDNGSPSTTVQVGPSGLVAVYAEAIMDAGDGDLLSVQLYEPTALPGCETILLNDTTSRQLKTVPGSSSGTTNQGGWLILRVPEGERTFSLRYGYTGSGGGAPPLATQAFLHVVPL